MTRKLISALLAVLILTSVLSVAALAEDKSRTFEFVLSSGGETEVTAEQGAVITVQFTLKNTGAEGNYRLYAVQNEITYDGSVFELVQGSIELSDDAVQYLTGVSVEYNTGTRDVEGTNLKRVLFSWYSQKLNGDEVPASLYIGSFKLKALKAGTGTIENANNFVTTQDGQEHYASTETALTFTVKGADTSGGGSGGGGGGGAQEPPASTVPLPDTAVKLIGSADGLIPDSAVSQTQRFRDIGTDHWAYNYIEYLSAMGYVNGKQEGLFFPSDSITRAEFVTILARMSGEHIPDVTVSLWTDVPAGAYYASSVAWAAEAGITLGTGDAEFSPNRSITRQEICAMIVRFASYLGYGFAELSPAQSFSDDSEIALWAKPSVLTLQKANLISGFSDSSFSPNSPASRAQSAKILSLLDFSISQ
ncbi:MAG: S-layer homology domain-containing protein [Oscillospiraceae bacterium]|jgi:hypothetical protein|nr:S-layer homology domain-containing protein [Oscillospiraceae bacterium]